NRHSRFLRAERRATPRRQMGALTYTRRGFKGKPTPRSHRSSAWSASPIHGPFHYPAQGGSRRRRQLRHIYREIDADERREKTAPGLVQKAETHTNHPQTGRRPLAEIAR